MLLTALEAVLLNLTRIRWVEGIFFFYYDTIKTGEMANEFPYPVVRLWEISLQRASLTTLKREFLFRLPARNLGFFFFLSSFFWGIGPQESVRNGFFLLLKLFNALSVTMYLSHGGGSSSHLGL